MMDNNKTDKIKRTIAIVKLLLLIGIIVGIPVYIYFFQHDLIEKLSDFNSIEASLREHKTSGAFVYIVLQAIQNVICIVPAQVLQISAGYIYGAPLGLLLSLVGVFFGSLMSYYIARALGTDAMYVIFGEKKMDSFVSQVKGKKGVMVLFLFYLIPGAPKDLCNYAAGLAELKVRPFVLVSLLGRIPGMMGSLLVGHEVVLGNYSSAVIIGCIYLVLFVLGMIYRKKVMAFFDRVYDKLM